MAGAGNGWGCVGAPPKALRGETFTSNGSRAFGPVAYLERGGSARGVLPRARGAQSLATAETCASDTGAGAEG